MSSSGRAVKLTAVQTLILKLVKDQDYTYYGICRLVGNEYAPSSIRGYISTLVDFGFLERSAGSRYRAIYRLTELGESYQRQIEEISTKKKHDRIEETNLDLGLVLIRKGA